MKFKCIHVLLILVILLASCTPTDNDNDGSPESVDCDDFDPNNYPGNTEVCDGQDNNCDENADEGFDEDNDGYTTCGGDCLDQDSYVHPDAEEVCDGIDNDCDGQIDVGCECTDGSTQSCGIDVGSCQSGTQTCLSGTWGECEGEVGPSFEVCDDSQDNDCDSLTDCNDDDCSTDEACSTGCSPLEGDLFSMNFNAGSAQDRSVNSNHGTLAGGVTYMASGGHDNSGAFYFDGVDDGIELSAPVDITGKSFTISAWVKADADASPDQQVYFAIHDKAEDRKSLHLRLDNSNDYQRSAFYLSKMDSPHDLVEYGEWQHWVFVFFSSADAGRIYLNGQEVAHAPDGLGPFLGDPQKPSIGYWRSTGTSQQRFKGLIDDVQMFSWALNRHEVEDLYEGSCPEEPECGDGTCDSGEDFSNCPEDCEDPDAGLLFIAPSGSDSNPGSRAQPWGTFDHALSQLAPGDTLVLLDGLYTKDNTGYMHIDCQNSGHANGNPGNPVTIKADNERLAHIKSDGSGSAIKIWNCANYDFIGLRGQGADLTDTSGGKKESVIYIRYSNNINMHRMLGSHNNRYFNNHVFEIGDSNDILIEESEAHYSHRHLFSVWQSYNVVLRRNYADGHDHPDMPGCQPYTNGGPGWCSHGSPGADEAFVFYRSSNNILENSISAGSAEGFQVHGGPEIVSGINGGDNNKILGTISIDSITGFQDDARKDGSGGAWPAEDNYYEDILVLDPDLNAIWFQATTNTIVDGLTVIGAQEDGLTGRYTSANPCDNPGEGCYFTIRNAIFLDNRKDGVEVQDYDEWTIEHSNFFNNGWEDGPGGYWKDVRPEEDLEDANGHVINSMSIEPTRIGKDEGECLVFIPDDSNMKGAGKDGADIGANILYRYEDGVLTSEPLWDPTTGQFPCGVHVEELVSGNGWACNNVHTRLNVNTNGCDLPY